MAKNEANRVAYDELGVYINTKNMIGIIEYMGLCENDSIRAIGIAFLCESRPEEQEFRGSFQTEEIETFKMIPDNTIPEQKRFLEKLKAERHHGQQNIICISNVC